MVLYCVLLIKHSTLKNKNGEPFFPYSKPLRCVLKLRALSSPCKANLTLTLPNLK